MIVAHVPFGSSPWRVQPVVATPGCWSNCSCWLNTSAGVFQPSTLRGRLFRARATASRSFALHLERSVPFGKYWHRYAYGGDDPTNNLDPKGLLSGRELVGSCLVGGGLGGGSGRSDRWRFRRGVGAAPGFVGELLVGCAAGGLANLEAQYGFGTTGQLIDDFGYLRILTDLLGP